MDPNAIGYEVDFLPVGDGEKSGDAIALRFGQLLLASPRQTVVVIDGGYKDNGEALVRHIRQYYKTNRVDAVICTHPDNDHASGIEVVLNEMDVRNLLMHLPWNHTDNTEHLFEDDRVTDESVKRALRESLTTSRDLETLARKKGINIVEPYSNVTGFDSAMRVLGPSKDFFRSLLPGYRGTPAPKAGLGYQVGQLVKEAKGTIAKVAESWGFETLDNSGETSAENSSSAITLFTISGDSLLFTGDAGIPALARITSSLQNVGFDFSRLKFIQLPHHGSQRNIGPALLDVLVGPKQDQQVTIKTAFASASPGGAPKHPAKKVTNAFLRRGAPVHCTMGSARRHHKNAPDRGWGKSTPIPFYNEVEE